MATPNSTVAQQQGQQRDRHHVGSGGQQDDAGGDVGDERWQVTGSAAEVYERELVPAIFGPWAPRVVALAAPVAGGRVLDVACGTGVVARLAAERVAPDGQVVGLDLNPGMLAVASSVPVAGAPVGWVRASAVRMPFPDRSFEVVCCQLGLQYVPDGRPPWPRWPGC
jgi:SAM-dependent methyltransferase